MTTDALQVQRRHLQACRSALGIVPSTSDFAAEFQAALAEAGVAP